MVSTTSWLPAGSNVCTGVPLAGAPEICHEKGLRTNATMLHSHCETPVHRVEHLLKLRALQDETGGFLAFIPLTYHPQGNALKVDHVPGALAELREFAVARLMLDVGLDANARDLCGTARRASVSGGARFSRMIC